MDYAGSVKHAVGVLRQSVYVFFMKMYIFVIVSTITL